MNCLFNEPWIGQCNKVVSEKEICCEKHSSEKCHVCGEQATTRCQASIGLMCGIPLCDLCGSGEMCLYHASAGPLFALRCLLGAGPFPGIFSDKESLAEEATKMNSLISRLRSMNIGPTMKEFEQALERKANAKPV
jgi:hypothetical protein